MTSSSEVDTETEKILLQSSEESEFEEDDIPHRTKELFKTEDINSYRYNREVRRIILNNMDITSKLTSANYLTFSDNFQKMGGRKGKKPDPKIDAWMLVKGKRRDIFEAKAFLNRYLSIRGYLEKYRENCRVVVTELYD